MMIGVIIKCLTADQRRRWAAGIIEWLKHQRARDCPTFCDEGGQGSVGGEAVVVGDQLERSGLNRA